MFGDLNSPIISSVSQNDPSISFASNPIVGNLDFNVQAIQPKNSKVEAGFPQIPYVGLEWLIYFAQSSNPIKNPVFATGGSNTGQQSISGQVTQTDASGIVRYAQGNQIA